MGQSQSKPNRGSTSSTAPLASNAAPVDDPLLEKNYAAFYSSDTYNSISAAAARPPLDPTAAQFASHPAPTTGITAPAPRQQLLRVSELIDPAELISRSNAHVADVYDPKRTGLNPNASPNKGPLTDADKNKRLPGLVESPSGNIFSLQEFAAHPRRPLAIRERQEGIKAALAKAQIETDVGTARAPLVPRKDTVYIKGNMNTGKGMRKGSGDSTASKLSKSSNGTVDSGVSFGNSEGKNTDLGQWESRKIEEGRREFEERQVKKKEKKGLCCFG